MSTPSPSHESHPAAVPNAMVPGDSRVSAQAPGHMDVCGQTFLFCPQCGSRRDLATCPPGSAGNSNTPNAPQQTNRSFRDPEDVPDRFH